jgi:hypothetical protein
MQAKNRAFAIFLTPLISHYPPPLRLNFNKKNIQIFTVFLKDLTGSLKWIIYLPEAKEESHPASNLSYK